MKINNTYSLGDMVYLVTDPEQNRGIITGIVVQPTGIFYQVTIGGETHDCFDIELSSEKNVI